MRVGVVDGIPESLESTTDGLSVLRLEVPLVGSLWRLRGDSCQVFQYPEQLGGGGGGGGEERRGIGRGGGKREEDGGY